MASTMFSLHKPLFSDRLELLQTILSEKNYRLTFIMKSWKDGFGHTHEGIHLILRAQSPDDKDIENFTCSYNVEDFTIEQVMRDSVEAVARALKVPLYSYLVHN